jgi:guanylate kinase
MQEKRVGIPIVISAASGTGKTSLCDRLLTTLSQTERSISFTTRAPRGEEKDGIDYHFVSNERFDEMVAAGEFIEHAGVFGNRYGTGRTVLNQQLSSGVDVLLDIDVQGGAQIKSTLPDALLIFLLPPSMEELQRRLFNRRTDAPDVIARRLAKARDEIQQADRYEYLVVNDDFEAAAEELRAIIKARRLRQNRRRELIASLVGNVIPRT